MPKVLVTGGAGYIGSHTVLALNEAGYEVVVYDNLSTGKEEAVIPPARLETGDLSETDKLGKIMRRENFNAIIHFAASIVVPESISLPLKYYLNNTSNTARLINLATKHEIPHFVFSSTAAVYGLPSQVPVDETTPLNPINPYGHSKLMSEQILRDTNHAQPGFKYLSLRYFNVAGADPEGRIGQQTPNATHLIKVACQAALGKRNSLAIFGTDYPTEDGTGIRDYIHVVDLADVHLRALQYLEEGNGPEILNCGYGRGYSVREIIEAVRKVSGKDFPVQETDRRPGDPARLVADPRRLNSKMDWYPAHKDIEEIVRSALEWEKKLP